MSLSDVFSYTTTATLEGVQIYITVGYNTFNKQRWGGPIELRKSVYRLRRSAPRLPVLLRPEGRAHNRPRAGDELPYPGIRANFLQN